MGAEPFTEVPIPEGTHVERRDADGGQELVLIRDDNGEVVRSSTIDRSGKQVR